jgi:transcriptional regulator NrdR family protein
MESRVVDAMLRRRRLCNHCGHRFSTYEMDDGMVKTIKKHMLPHMRAVAKRVALTQRNEKIIEMLKEGVKHSAIAVEFGLSDNMISTIARRNGMSSYRQQARRKSA